MCPAGQCLRGCLASAHALQTREASAIITSDNEGDNERDTESMPSATPLLCRAHPPGPASLSLA